MWAITSLLDEHRLNTWLCGDFEGRMQTERGSNVLKIEEALA